MTTMTKMKMSSKTLNLLKNYASINSNILVKPGNKIATISPVKNVMSEAIVEEDFDTEFGIWDLNKFLGVVSLFDKPEFAFSEKSVTIYGGSASVEYYYSEPSLLSVPTKSIDMPEGVVSFKWTQKNFAELQKASSVVQVSDLAVRTNGDNLELAVLDKNDVTSNCYTIDLGEVAGGHDFCFYFKVENLKMIEGDYNVDISNKNISQFSGNDVVYWIALETDSKYNG